MGFPWQTYWSGLSLPAPGDLPDPGIESASPVLAGRFFTAEPPRKPLFSYRIYCLGESESRSVVSNSSRPHGLLEWVAVPFSRESSQPRDRTQVSCIAGGFFTSWATGKPKNTGVGSLSIHQQISLPRNWTGASSIAGGFFTNWAIREAPYCLGTKANKEEKNQDSKQASPTTKWGSFLYAVVTPALGVLQQAPSSPWSCSSSTEVKLL